MEGDRPRPRAQGPDTTRPSTSGRRNVPDLLRPESEQNDSALLAEASATSVKSNCSSKSASSAASVASSRSSTIPRSTGTKEASDARVKVRPAGPDPSEPHALLLSPQSPEPGAAPRRRVLPCPWKPSHPGICAARCSAVRTPRAHERLPGASARRSSREGAEAVGEGVPRGVEEGRGCCHSLPPASAPEQPELAQLRQPVGGSGASAADARPPPARAALRWKPLPLTVGGSRHSPFRPRAHALPARRTPLKLPSPPSPTVAGPRRLRLPSLPRHRCPLLRPLRHDPLGLTPNPSRPARLRLPRQLRRRLRPPLRQRRRRQAVAQLVDLEPLVRAGRRPPRHVAAQRPAPAFGGGPPPARARAPGGAAALHRGGAEALEAEGGRGAALAQPAG